MTQSRPSVPARSSMVLGLALTLALGSSGCGGESASSAREVGWRGSVLDEPIAKVDFTLPDTDGKPFHFRDATRGKLTLLFFGYTHCPDICPVQLANIAAVMQEWPFDLRERVRVVFVSTDPERDTPERIREWLGAMDPSFVGLRGPVSEVNDIERSLGLPPSSVQSDPDPDKYVVAHAAQVLAFTPDDLAHIVFPFGTRQADLAIDLPRLAREGFTTPEGS